MKIKKVFEILKDKVKSEYEKDKIIGLKEELKNYY